MALKRIDTSASLTPTAGPVVEEVITQDTQDNEQSAEVAEQNILPTNDDVGVAEQNITQSGSDTDLIAEVESTIPEHVVSSDDENMITSHFQAATSLPEIIQLLNTLSPIFKAMIVCPGPHAAPEKQLEAITRMSQASVELANRIVAETEALELDPCWAKSQAVQSITSMVVSEEWVNKAIIEGITAGKSGTEPVLPVISTAQLMSQIRPVLTLPAIGMPEPTQEGLAVGLMSVLSVLGVELDRYARAVNAHCPLATVDVDALLQQLSAFLIELTEDLVPVLLKADPEANERQLQQQLVKDAGHLLVPVWSVVRSSVYSSLKDEPEKALAMLQSADFEFGVPLTFIKERLRTTLSQVVSTAAYALSLRRGAAS